MPNEPSELPGQQSIARALMILGAAATVAALWGCMSSARHEYFALRANAPKPERGSPGVTLAEAEMSNVGPTRPPTALAGVNDR